MPVRVKRFNPLVLGITEVPPRGVLGQLPGTFSSPTRSADGENQPVPVVLVHGLFLLQHGIPPLVICAQGTEDGTT